MASGGRTIVAAVTVAVWCVSGAASAIAGEHAEFVSLTGDDPDFVSFAAGWYNMGDDDDQAAEFRLEYRSDLELWILKPFATISGTTSGSFFVGGGLLADVYFGPSVVLTASLSANYYAQGGADFDLGYPLEVRSQAELAYRFEDHSRLGLAFSHTSNAGLGDPNPGCETLSVYYSLALGPGE